MGFLIPVAIVTLALLGVFFIICATYVAKEDDEKTKKFTHDGNEEGWEKGTPAI